MINSMTGYGRREVRSGERAVTIEIRSVNNRYIDVQVKMPRGLIAFEPRIRKSVQDRFSRGRFDVYVGWSGGEEKNTRFLLNEERAGQYIGILRDLKARFSLPGEIDLPLIAGAPDIITVAEPAEDPESIWNAIAGGLNDSLDELRRMRGEEGAALARDIADRLESIGGLLSRIRSQAPVIVEAVRKRLSDALRKFLAEEPDSVRISQEIAILADRTDISEELTRMDSHIRQFRTMLENPQNESIGRKLDFMIQEMGREVNTIGSKAMDAEISLATVNIKAELEKIREQVQNIE